MRAKHIIPALLLTCSFAAPARAADSFTGEWVSMADQNRTFTCSFTQKGDALSGTCSTPGPGGQPVIGAASGKVNGKNVTWTFVLKRDAASRTTEYAGEWDLKNTVTVQATVKDISVNGQPAGVPLPAPRQLTFTRSPAK